MAEVNISINGKQYGIACDDGQEQRVLDLANFVDGRLKEIAAAGAGANDSHLLVLTSIVMADELFDARDNASNGSSAPLGGIQITEADETQITAAIDQMVNRIDTIAGNLAKI
jgi:cell division protein ZapA